MRWPHRDKRWRVVRSDIAVCSRVRGQVTSICLSHSYLCLCARDATPPRSASVLLLMQARAPTRPPRRARGGERALLRRARRVTSFAFRVSAQRTQVVRLLSLHSPSGVGVRREEVRRAASWSIAHSADWPATSCHTSVHRQAPSRTPDPSPLRTRSLRPHGRAGGGV